MGNKFVTQIRKTFNSIGGGGSDNHTNKNQSKIDVAKKPSSSLHHVNDDGTIHSISKWSLGETEIITGVDSLGNFQRGNSKKDTATRQSERVSLWFCYVVVC